MPRIATSPSARVMEETYARAWVQVHILPQKEVDQGFVTIPGCSLQGPDIELKGQGDRGGALVRLTPCCLVHGNQLTQGGYSRGKRKAQHHPHRCQSPGVPTCNGRILGPESVKCRKKPLPQGDSPGWW